MSGPPGGPALRPAAGVARPDLEELLQRVRRELAARDEDPTGAWVEETAGDLISGAKPGVYLTDGVARGIAFYARRGPSAFGHLHAEGGVEGALRLALALRDGLPSEVASLDLGFSGLAPDDERTVAATLGRTAGSTVIEREALDRPLGPADGRFPPEPPAGLERVPVRAVTLDALAELDRAAFAGTVDALLLSAEPGANRRSIEAILDGRLGRFLDEASAALLEPDPPRLVGAVLNAERSSRRALVLDLMVEPARRRQGLGRFLLGWGLRALWALGYESARLWVTVRNEPAAALYRAVGFRPSLRATIYRWDRGGAPAQPHASR